MQKVFVSYSRNDLNAVLALEQRIGERVSLWRDQKKIYGGDRWPKVLGEAIDANHVVLLVWSQHSAASHYVEFEWCTALALKKRIIPWLLDETPLPPSLRAANGFDARSGKHAVMQLMKSLGTRLPAADTRQSAKVIGQLGEITAKQPKAVVKAARAIFNPRKWVVHGNVFQAARDQHITIQAPKKPRQNEEAEDDKRNVLTAIKHELTKNLQLIDKLESDIKRGIYEDLQDQMEKAKIPGAGRFIVLPHVKLARMALDTAIHSGKYFSLKDDIAELIKEGYRRIDVVNEWSDQLRTIGNTSHDSSSIPIIGSLYGTIEGTIGNLKKSLPATIRQLEEQLAEDVASRRGRIRRQRKQT
jgi:hypothetical protein